MCWNSEQPGRSTAARRIGVSLVFMGSDRPEAVDAGDAKAVVVQGQADEDVVGQSNGGTASIGRESSCGTRATDSAQQGPHL